MIPDDKIEEVKERASIVQVVSDYVPLKKKGINHLGLCPFHSEKTPSFTVSEEKKIFHCFGCNATGNVISFLMKKEGITFPEAVQSLAKRYGITITEEKKGSTDAREGIYRALNAALEYFVAELKGPSGAKARAYLDRRGFGGEIAERFRVGYAPDRWDGLVGHLRKRAVPMEAAERAGVVAKKDKGGHYDKFRGRIIFPITDAKGRVAGFGGRTLDDSKGPKYLNSPETAVFKKGSTLFGLFQAKQGIIKESYAIVVEGYFDLMALHKHGFTNSVATMGTALTSQHLRELKPFASTVYCLFDADEAGRNAAIRGLDLFIEEDVPCRAVILKSGKDPDEFLKAEGAEAMKDAIGKAAPLMEFYLEELKKKIDLKTPEGKRRFLEASGGYLAKVRNVAERGHYAAHMATTLGIPVEAVFESIKGGRAHAARPGNAAGQMISAPDARASRLKELTLVRLIARHPELYDARIDEAVASFLDPVLKEIGSSVASFCRDGRAIDPSALMESLESEDARSTAASLLIREDDGFIESPKRMLEDSLKRIFDKGKLKDSTRETLKRLEESGYDVADAMKKRGGPQSRLKKGS